MDSYDSRFARDYPARFYENFYNHQSGGSAILPHFRPQRGRGIFGKIFRGFVLPTLGKAANVLKREAPKRLLSLGRDVLEDVVEGKSLGSSLKRRGVGQLKRAANDILTDTPRKTKRRRKQVGSGGGGARSGRRIRSSGRRRQSVRRRKTKTTRRRGRRRTNRSAQPLFARGRDIFV